MNVQSRSGKQDARSCNSTPTDGVSSLSSFLPLASDTGRPQITTPGREPFGEDERLRKQEKMLGCFLFLSLFFECFWGKSNTQQKLFFFFLGRAQVPVKHLSYSAPSPGSSLSSGGREKRSSEPSTEDAGHVADPTTTGAEGPLHSKAAASVKEKEPVGVLEWGGIKMNRLDGGLEGQGGGGKGLERQQKFSLGSHTAAVGVQLGSFFFE